MRFPIRHRQRRIQLLAALLAVGAAAVAVVWVPVLPRAPDLYVHLVWSWQVMRCLADGQLPLWLPDLNAGFGSPGIRLYSPAGPVLTGGLGLLLGEAGRGLRAAVLLAAAAILAAPSSLRGDAAGRKRNWTGLLVLISPMVLFSLIGRAAWSEYLAIPFLWWVIERVLDGRIRADRDGSAVAALWLFHAPSALMAGGIGAASLLLHRSREHALRLVQLAVVGGGLSAWHWLPLLQESAELGSGEVLKRGIFEPTRNLLGSASAHAPQHNIWLGWVAVSLLVSILVTASWRHHAHRTAVAVGCIVLASPFAAPLWRIETPLQLLQFPWRWLLPATLVLGRALIDARSGRIVGIACLVAPSLLMTGIHWARMPALDAELQWRDTGRILYEALGANPLVVDAEQNRPPAFADLAGNLSVFGRSEVVVVSGIGKVKEIRRWSPLRREVEIEGSTPLTVGFRILDYPFWSVSSDRSGDARPGGVPGVVACRLPPGRHLVRVSWRGNPLASAGQIVAAVTVIGLALGRRRWAGAMS